MADLAAGVAAAIGLIFVGYQTLALRREQQRVSKAELLSAHDGITDRMATISHLFIAQSWLRPYFYASADHTTLEPLQRETVLGVADLLTDFIENTIVHRRVLGTDALDVWHEYAKDLIRLSPAMREYIDIHRSWYVAEVGALLDDWRVASAG